MVKEKEVSSGGLEWRIKMNDGSSKVLVAETGPFRKVWLGIVGLFLGFVGKVWNFLQKAWNVGADDPRKVVHGLKVGLALSLVSLFYYVRPLYNGVGGNAMWAVMTVVVVFENTVGATFSKSINRGCGTFLAGALGLGVHYVATQAGPKFEPIILGTSVFILASGATFSRFIPTVKTRFDYGTMIFILTFSLVSVSGYRVDKLIEMAHQRLSTILIGTSICLLISMLVCPIWAGQDLHLLIARNMDKLADSLDGCITEYFKDYTGESSDEGEEENPKNLQGYKCVLNSKATEESLANFARWEPAHGNFSFQHPWKQYLKVGSSLRSCAYCIEALSSCISSEIQAPNSMKKHLKSTCITLSSQSSSILKELSTMTKSMKKSSTLDISVGEMSMTVDNFRTILKFLPTQLSPPQAHDPPQKNEPDVASTTAAVIPLMEVLPLVTVSSLLLEIATRTREVVNSVKELSNMADFKPAADNKKSKQPPPPNKQEEETMKTVQLV